MDIPTAASCRWLAPLACAVLVGCETTTETAGLQCGAGGAVGGYVLCKALGGSDAQCLSAGALLGAGGAALCYNYASNLERRRAQLAGQENNLDARIRYVRGLNEDSEKLNGELTERVAAVTRSTDQLVAQIQQRRISQEQLARERKARDDEVRAASLQVAKGTEALNEVKAYRAQRKVASPDLDLAIARQEKLLADAQRQVQLLSAQRARVV